MAKKASTRPAGRVMFTGGSGKAGKHVVQYLVDHGYQVLNLDAKPLDNPKVRTLITDICDSGQVFNALTSYMGLHEFDPSLRPQQVDAVVHFAAIPRIMITPDNEVFRVNTMGTYNVIEAAVKLGIRKVIVASSETTYGLVFANEPKDPEYLPLDEEYDVDPMDSYALSKVLNEKTARAFQTRSGYDLYALRIGNVIERYALYGCVDNPDQTTPTRFVSGKASSSTRRDQLWRSDSRADRYGTVARAEPSIVPSRKGKLSNGTW